MAWGCSLVDGALLPTNFELVQTSDAIVLAQATEETRRGSGSFTGVRFTIVEMLRGSYPEKVLALAGGLPFAGASPEDDFSRARPGAFAGSCTAFDYRIGHLYVLFLERHDAKWDLHRVAFSRVNEEVASADSPWVSAVREYSRIADLGDYERRKQALIALSHRASPPLARDIERHFATPTAAKSVADLLALYRAAKNKDTHVARAALFGLSSHDDPATAAVMHELLAGEPPASYESPLCAWAEGDGNRGEFANVLRLARRSAHPGWSACGTTLAVMARPEDYAVLRPLLAKMKDDEARVFFEQAHGLAGAPEALAELRRRAAGRFRENSGWAELLAAWGDRDVVLWARGAGQGPGEHRWVAGYVLARSPRAEATEFLEELLHGQDTEMVAAVLEGLGDSRRENRLEWVQRALTAFPTDGNVTRAARLALRRLDEQGVPGAAGLLGSLPAEPDEDDGDE